MVLAMLLITPCGVRSNLARLNDLELSNRRCVVEVVAASTFLSRGLRLPTSYRMSGKLLVNRHDNHGPTYRETSEACTAVDLPRPQ